MVLGFRWVGFGGERRDNGERDEEGRERTTRIGMGSGYGGSRARGLGSLGLGSGKEEGREERYSEEDEWGVISESGFK